MAAVGSLSAPALVSRPATAASRGACSLSKTRTAFSSTSDQPLELGQDVPRRGFLQRPTVHYALDERGLHHQQLAHEVVYRSGRADVRHVHGVRLSDAVRPVLRLPVVRGNPVQVVENHLPRRREIEPDAAGMDVRDEDTHAFVVLEPVDELLASRGGRRARQQDRTVGEMAVDALQRLIEAGEDDDLLPLLDRALDQIDRVVDLGNRELAAHRGEVRDETAARLVALCYPVGAVRHAEQYADHLAHTGSAGASRNIHLEPCPQFGRKLEHVRLRAAQHHSLELRGQLLEVRRAIRHPAVAVVVRRAVTLGEAEEATAHRVAHELEQREQVARPVHQRRAGECVDDGATGPALGGGLDQPARVPAPLAPVVLDVLGLVEDEA